MGALLLLTIPTTRPGQLPTNYQCVLTLELNMDTPDYHQSKATIFKFNRIHLLLSPQKEQT